VETRDAGDRTVLELYGELDLAEVHALTNVMERPEVRASSLLVIDVEELQFIDSAGLRAILAEHERRRREGAQLALTRGSPQVQRLLDIAGVEEHLRFVDSAEESPLAGGDAPSG
jgi:anti-anti-sigma factor